MKNTLKFYQNIYDPLFKKNYTKKSNRAEPALNKFKDFSDKNNIIIKKMIDVGCAWGKTLEYWKRKKIKAFGVDVSKIAVRKCVKKGFKAVVASATDLSMFDDKVFDLYMATDVYEHLRTSDLDNAIEEARRVTNGYFLIRPHPVLDKRGTLHLTVWSLDKWQIFFERHGLHIINIGDDGDVTYKNVFLMTNTKG